MLHYKLSQHYGTLHQTNWQKFIRLFNLLTKKFLNATLYEIKGVRAKPIIEPKIKGSKSNYVSPLPLSEWLTEFRVGVKLPIKIIVSKEQIANKLGLPLETLEII